MISQYGAVVLISVTNPFSDTKKQFYCNNMKYGT